MKGVIKMGNLKAERALPWVQGLVAACAAFLTISHAVQAEWLKAVAWALIAAGTALQIRRK